MSVFWSEKDAKGNKVGQMSTQTSPKDGTYIRIKSFKFENTREVKEGPYCKALNQLLGSYSTNFGANGVIQASKKPAICNSAISQADLTNSGLAYDVGRYAWAVDGDHYKKVGKA